MNAATFQALALAFPGTESKPHFDRTAFKVIKKRTFATLHEPSSSANIMLTPADQAEFCALHPAIHPVEGGWGRMGATTFPLEETPDEITLAALETAYQATITPKAKK